jgi:O-acetyl-ADP-ribose deacetylase (regulator of RNase III)
LYPVHSLRLNDSCELRLSVGDITQWDGQRYWADGRYERCAIVNAANETLLGGTGVDGAIHEAAGRALREECAQFPQSEADVRCPPGEVRMTGGHNLGVEHVIHTVGPRYHNEETSAPVLRSCYEASLRLAGIHKLQAIAFPALSCGAFGYPLEEAAEIALQTCRTGTNKLRLIEFVLFHRSVLEIWLQAARRQIETWSLCPTCQLPRHTTPRYSEAICSSCAGQTTDSKGRSVTFRNTSLSGGLSGTYSDDEAPYQEGSDCWVHGIPCTAQEARFGGVVITLRLN